MASAYLRLSHSVKNADILIKNGIHERDVIDWFEFIIDEDHTFK